jgi:hypothetical protein
MANWLKDEIADLGDTLDRSIKTGTSELQKKLDLNINTASRELSANVDRIGARFDVTVAKAEEGLKATVETASLALEKNIRILSSEIHAQRSLTKEDVIHLIDYANQKFDQTIERRVIEIKSQTSALIDDKLTSIRKSLSEAAAEQKKVFLRNAAIAVGSAIIVAIVSISSKKLSNSPLDALTVFRIVLGMFAAGGAASLLYRVFLRYKTKSEVERDAIKIIISDVRMLNPKGFAFQAAILLLAISLWIVLSIKPELLGF